MIINDMYFDNLISSLFLRILNTQLNVKFIILHYSYLITVNQAFSDRKLVIVSTILMQLIFNITYVKRMLALIFCLVNGNFKLC